MEYRKIIRGENCCLKRFEAGDEKLVNIIYKLFTDPELSQLINPEYLKNDTKAKVRNWIMKKSGHDYEVWYAIITKENYIGYVCFKSREHYDDACEISTALTKEARGKHLGYESSLILVDYVKQLGKFKYIVAYTLKENKKAENNLKKIGFKKSNRLQKKITAQFYNDDGSSETGSRYNLMAIHLKN